MCRGLACQSIHVSMRKRIVYTAGKSKIIKENVNLFRVHLPVSVLRPLEEDKEHSKNPPRFDQPPARFFQAIIAIAQNKLSQNIANKEI